MSTLQIALVAAAVVALLVLIVVRVATRRSASRSAEEEAKEPTSSFLDDAPQDTLAGLGKVDASAPALSEVNPAEPHEVTAASGTDAVTLLPEEEMSSPLTGDIAGADQGTPAAFGAAPVSPDGVEPSLGVEAESATADTLLVAEPVVEPAREALVPLSSIMVTTSSKLVNLNDPEVRRMLTDLIGLEIDQAGEFQRQGLTVDAVMQLSEAEKISHALRLEESAQRIREMSEELRRMQ